MPATTVRTDPPATTIAIATAIVSAVCARLASTGRRKSCSPTANAWPQLSSSIGINPSVTSRRTTSMCASAARGTSKSAEARGASRKSGTVRTMPTARYADTAVVTVADSADGSRALVCSATYFATVVRSPNSSAFISPKAASALIDHRRRCSRSPAVHRIGPLPALRRTPRPFRRGCTASSGESLRSPRAVRSHFHREPQ